MSDNSSERGYERVHLGLRRIMINNFLGGVAWGFGTVIGASVVVGVILWTLNQVGLFNLLGTSVQNFQDSLRQSVETLSKFR